MLYSPRAFEADAWKLASEKQRTRMIGDLQISGILLGKTRKEVAELLGLPDGDSGRAYTRDEDPSQAETTILIGLAEAGGV